MMSTFSLFLHVGNIHDIELLGSGYFKSNIKYEPGHDHNNRQDRLWLAGAGCVTMVTWTHMQIHQ